MAQSKTRARNTPNGAHVSRPTDKRTIVLARDVVATVLDAVFQARKAGMRSAIMSKNGVLIVGFALNGVAITVKNGKVLLGGRAITDPDAWDDLRDVMAEEDAPESVVADKETQETEQKGDDEDGDN